MILIVSLIEFREIDYLLAEKGVAQTTACGRTTASLSLACRNRCDEKHAPEALQQRLAPKRFGFGFRDALLVNS